MDLMDLIVGASAAAIATAGTSTSNVGQLCYFGGSSKMTTIDYAGTSADDTQAGTSTSQTAVLGRKWYLYSKWWSWCYLWWSEMTLSF